MTIANYAELKILDAVFNNTSFVVAQPYVKLHISDPCSPSCSPPPSSRTASTNGTASHPGEAADGPSGFEPQ